jgi:carboxypeptidase Q
MTRESMMRPLLVLVCGIAPALAMAQAPVVPEAVLTTAAELRDAALESNGAYDMVSSLVTEVGPRFAGTSGDAASVAWAMRTMREAGLQNVRTEPVEVPRWVRGDIEVSVTGPFPQGMVAVALGGSVGTPAEGVEAPVVMVHDIEELRAMPDDEVSGKIVFFSRRMERLQDGSDYGRTVANRTQGPVEAARRGAVGVVIRSVGTSNARIAHTGVTRYDDEVTKIPAVAVSNPDADMLERQLATGRTVTLYMQLSARRLSPGRSANVIAEVPGRGSGADEVVILGAHLDSWDITPGAHDDAAGVAIVVEAARQIAAQRRNPPRRTIRVVLFANEESGLDGARAYAERHSDDVERHVIGLGADAGSGGAWRFDSGVDEAALPVVDALAGLLEPLDIPQGPNTAGGIADLSPLRAAGVPMLDIRQDMRPYFDIHHTINDTLDKVDRAELDRNVAAYVALLYVLAYTDIDFGRHPDFSPSD